MPALLDLTLLQLVDTLAARRASPVELMGEVYDRVEATAGTLNAVVAVRDRDAALADAADAESRIRNGTARALEGIPLGVKDLENVRGMVTSRGSRLYGEHVAADDDIHVARLRAAGAIPMAKTNVPEFGPMPITKNLLHGVTRSPWNIERSPGGSSGGSAAAVCGGVLPLVTASDGGGSIRIPAAWTGLFGFKPSHGRVPIGPSPYWDASMMSVYGPLSKTVEDACLYLDQLVGASRHDPGARPHPGYRYLDRVRGSLPAGLRVGFAPDFARVVVAAEVGAAVEDGVGVLERLGCRIEAVAEGPPRVGPEWNALVGFALAGTLREVLPGNEDRIQRYLLTLIEQGRAMTPETWAGIQEDRARVRDWCAEVFSRVDVLVTPTVPYEAPNARGPLPAETDGKPQDPLAAAAFTQPFNLGWQPAASVRVGMSANGLPLGMQIVADVGRDDLVLQVSRAFERERPWREWPAP